jgi:hypothetical protein
MAAGKGWLNGEARAERREELVLRRAPAAREDMAAIQALAAGWGAAGHEHGAAAHPHSGAGYEHSAVRQEQSGAGHEHRSVRVVASSSRGHGAPSASTERGSTTNALAIQRVISAADQPISVGPSSAAPSQCEHDPQKLAEQIYRVIRRRLAIDRERAGASRAGRRW